MLKRTGLAENVLRSISNSISEKNYNLQILFGVINMVIVKKLELLKDDAGYPA